MMIPAAPEAATQYPNWVEVNEVHITLYASRDTANWWATYRQHFDTARFTEVNSCLIGDLVQVACENRDHAQWLHDLLIEKGVAKAALKIGGER